MVPHITWYGNLSKRSSARDTVAASQLATFEGPVVFAVASSKQIHPGENVGGAAASLQPAGALSPKR